MAILVPDEKAGIFQKSIKQSSFLKWNIYLTRKKPFQSRRRFQVLIKILTSEFRVRAVRIFAPVHGWPGRHDPPRIPGQHDHLQVRADLRILEKSFDVGNAEPDRLDQPDRKQRTCCPVKLRHEASWAGRKKVAIKERNEICRNLKHSTTVKFFW